MRGATAQLSQMKSAFQISTHTPHAGATEPGVVGTEALWISTHTPHAGRDGDEYIRGWFIAHFYSHAPCGARHLHVGVRSLSTWISTHTPHAGRDMKKTPAAVRDIISTHTPHAGRDGCVRRRINERCEFLLTRPMRGATNIIFLA